MRTCCSGELVSERGQEAEEARCCNQRVDRWVPASATAFLAATIRKQQAVHTWRLARQCEGALHRATAVVPAHNDVLDFEDCAREGGRRAQAGVQQLISAGPGRCFLWPGGMRLQW